MTVPADPWPDLFVNTSGRSVRSGVVEWLCSMRPKWPGARVTFVTGYLSVRGLLTVEPVLRDMLRSGARVRLLLGVAPHEQARITEPSTSSTADPAVLRRLLQEERAAVTAEVDAIPATKPESLALAGLADLLHHERVACRRYERGFLHAKSVLVEPPSGQARAVLGSANVTLAGWTSNQELLAEADTDRARQISSLALSWWDAATDFDLAALLRRRFCAWPHPLVFLRVLRALYGDEVNTPSALQLHDWQKDGVAKALATIARNGGVLIADEVGLGKTYEAGEILRHARDAGWGPALIVCPAHLRQFWRTKLTEWQLSAEVISYHKLNYLAGDFHATGSWPQYGLLICDEAHCLRNPTTSFATSVHELLDHQTGPTKRVLLTATPVSNHGRDLYELLTLTTPELEPDWRPSATLSQRRAATRSREANALLRRCEHADVLRRTELGEFHGKLDQLIVRRTRPFIREHYPNAPAFPTQTAVAISYQLSAQARRATVAVLDAVGASAEALSAASLLQLESLRQHRKPGAPLTLAAYELAAYARGTSGMPHATLSTLLRLQLCKRLESSPAALAGTATRMERRTADALADLDRGVVRIPTKNHDEHAARVLRQALHDAELDDDTSPAELDAVIEATAQRLSNEDVREASIADYDVARLRHDLEHDRRVLHQLAQHAWKTIPHDRKREALRDLLITAAAHPRGPKIVVLAGSRATTTDLGSWLRKIIDSDDRLSVYRGRTVNLGGADAPSRSEVEQAVAGFAPRTAGESLPAYQAARLIDRYDLLIGTDILAEGLNLQQSALLVHYDLPWNPQIMGQRSGRVDRIGSLHDEVFCYTIMPDTGLDLILNLLDRLRAKANIAAATVGVPTHLFPESPVAARDFATLFDEQHPQEAERPYFADRYRAWLGRALREPPIRHALDTLPPAAAALSPSTNGYTYCLSRTQSAHRTEQSTLCHINTRDRPGHTLFSRQPCLDEISTDLPRWIRDINRGKAPIPTQLPVLPDAVVREHWKLEEQARNRLDQHHGLADDHTDPGVELHAWIAPQAE